MEENENLKFDTESSQPATKRKLTSESNNSPSTSSPQKPQKKSKTSQEQIPPVPNKPRQCHFLVKRKQRYCSLPAKTGRKYCGEHSVLEEAAAGERIPCPYDNAHSVATSELERHLIVCNAKPKPPPAYFSENINGVFELSDASFTPRDDLISLSHSEFLDFVRKVNSIYETLEEIPVEIKDHEALHERLIETHNGKHALQQSSLLGHMRDSQLLKNEHVIIEFGAGRGELSSYVRKAIGDPCSLVLIDRKNFRKKYDKFLRGPSIPETTVIERIGMDIKDLDLTKFDLVTDKGVVGMSKHLCGCATDLTLRCLTNLDQSEHGNVKGIVIALCCHQLCKYSIYINNEYLEKIAISKREFGWMTTLSTWATCGRKAEPKTSEDDDKKEEPESEDREPDEDHSTEGMDFNDKEDGEHWSKLSYEDREEFGFKCKRILDYGRILYLREHGFEVRLVYYAERRVSLENCALVAFKKDEIDIGG
ncbi:hypothetical protein HK098_003111 [Nowakowskiella sp. JEL0407]|nr:hypothetical protein HK098_003111 [Nowakowskiella sp. JEL0407]